MNLPVCPVNHFVDFVEILCGQLYKYFMDISISQIHYSTIKSRLDMTVNVLDNVFSKVFRDFVEISTVECQQQSSLLSFVVWQETLCTKCWVYLKKLEIAQHKPCCVACYF
jgi:hypothetical protein